MGWRSQPTTAMMLDSVRVPASYRLGPEGHGFKIALGARAGQTLLCITHLYILHTIDSQAVHLHIHPLGRGPSLLRSNEDKLKMASTIHLCPSHFHYSTTCDQVSEAIPRCGALNLLIFHSIDM